MSQVQRILVAALPLVVWSGCGPVDACNSVENALLGLQGRLTDCQATNSFPLQTCEAGLTSCSAADKQTLTAFATCINEIPADDCDTDPNAETNASAALDSCSGNAGSISDACLSATGLDDTLGPPASTGFEESNEACPSTPQQLTGTGAAGAVCADYTTCAPVCCACSNGDGHQYLGAACQSGACADPSLVCPLVEQDQTGIDIPCP